MADAKSIADAKPVANERAEIGAASPLFSSQAEALRATAPLGRVLDLASGRGRHALAAAALGLNVLAIDQNAESLASLARAATATAGKVLGRIETQTIDLETGAPPDLPDEQFGAILVFRYLHRPLMPWIASRLREGGLLLYETFTTEQRSLGWGPKSDDFLLQPGELSSLFPELETEHSEEGPTEAPRPAITARLVARRAR